MKKWFKRVLLSLALVAGFLAVGLGSPVNAQAKADPHLPSRTIRYQITTKSTTYKNAWTNALKQWGKLYVVKFVPATGNGTPDVQLGTNNSKDSQDVYMTTESKKVTEQGTFVNYKVTLNRRQIKKADSKKTAMKAIGSLLGLKAASKKANSVLSPRKKAPTKPTKLDKKNLQKLYRGVSY